jgi:hypothetical protein
MTPAKIPRWLLYACLVVLVVGVIIAIPSGLFSGPDDDDDYEPGEVVRYPAPPPAPAPVVITRKSCYEGNIRYTTESFTKGKIEVLNDDECGFWPAVKAGLVQFLDHFGKPIGDPWRPGTEVFGTTIPVKAQCLAEFCAVKYVLCPNGQGPLPGSWDCQWSSPRGTTHEYGVAAGVDLRVGVYSKP